MTAGEFVQNLLKENFKEYTNLKPILEEIFNSQNKSGFNCYNIYENLIPKDGIFLFEQDGNLSTFNIPSLIKFYFLYFHIQIHAVLITMYV
jgi:hypothetical protein